MVALSVIAIVLCALTADYVVQRLALRIAHQPDEGYFLHPNHLWVHPESSGLASVGADSVIGVLLGRPWRIEWTSLGPVERGAPLAVVHGPGRSLNLCSPIDGEVVEQNSQLGGPATLASPDAVDAGWLVRMRPAALDASLLSMRTGKVLREWSRGEMERLRAFVLSRLPRSIAVGATAADGGPLAANLASCLDEDTWNEAVRLVLGEEAVLSHAIEDFRRSSVGGQS